MAHANEYIVKTEKLTAIADSIREKTGEAGTITIDSMPNKIAEVYEAGIEEGKGIFSNITNAEEVKF